MHIAGSRQIFTVFYLPDRQRKASRHGVVHWAPFTPSAECPPKPADAAQREAIPRTPPSARSSRACSPAPSLPDRRSCGHFSRTSSNNASAGQGHTLKESVLARELYGKGADFDGGSDPVVRVDARRLRDKLREFYEGRTDSVVISLPKGSYVPVFEEVSAAQAEPAAPPVVDDRKERRSVVHLGRQAAVLGAVALVALVSRPPSPGAHSARKRPPRSSCSPCPRTRVRRDRPRCRLTAISSPSPGRATPNLARATSMSRLSGPKRFGD